MNDQQALRIVSALANGLDPTNNEPMDLPPVLVDLACPSPLFGGRAAGKRLRLLVDEALAMMHADLRCVPA